jgi:hypothetical protein
MDRPCRIAEEADVLLADERIGRGFARAKGAENDKWQSNRALPGAGECYWRGTRWEKIE